MSDTLLMTLLHVAILVSFGGAALALVTHRMPRVSNALTQGIAMLVSLTVATVAIAVLAGNGPLQGTVALSELFTLTSSVDRLAAFFLLAIAIVTFAAALFGLRYVERLGKHIHAGALGCFTLLFLVSMLLVVTATNVFIFLVVWELMSLASYALVVNESHREENVRAGWIYLVMTHVGTAFIFLALLLLARSTGSMDFAGMREHAAQVPLAMQSLIFVLALVGFGTKAGIIPLHIWLPEAHPAAPSHISALLSGVMIKTAIYMLVRLFIDILPAPTVWWGLVVLILAAISSVVGVLYALAEHNLKRLLAYHSVENIGIILMGVGAALTFQALGQSALAALALTAGLFHVINHAIFKALLFLGAGAVLQETGTSNIEEYGGLIKRMPWTAATFLVGAVAISGLPPFNGFASEWLTFQALIGGLAGAEAMTRLVLIITIAALALTGGLAAACFVKAFGATFLARPRSAHAEQAREVPVSMRAAMVFLAVLCLVLGVGSPFVVRTLAPLTHELLTFTDALARTSWSGIHIGNTTTLAMPLAFLAIAALVTLLLLVIGWVTRRSKERVYTTWDCGNDLTPRMEFTATAFSHSLVTVFRGILRPTRQSGVEYHDEETRFLTKTLHMDHHVVSFANQFLYTPIARVTQYLARNITRLQNGSINAYLFYVFAVLFALLLFAR